MQKETFQPGTQVQIRVPAAGNLLTLEILDATVLRDSGGAAVECQIQGLGCFEVRRELLIKK